MLLARQVATTASAWRHAKADTEAYRRLVATVTAWDAYVAPRLDDSAGDPAAVQLRREARRALHAMDDEAARRAEQVATTASVWLRTATNTDAYRRYSAALDDWDDYEAPRLEQPTAELLDQLADAAEPVSLGEVVAEMTAQLHERSRR